MGCDAAAVTRVTAAAEALNGIDYPDRPATARENGRIMRLNAM